MVASDEPNLAKHMELESIPNLQVDFGPCVCTGCGQARHMLLFCRHDLLSCEQKILMQGCDVLQYSR